MSRHVQRPRLAATVVEKRMMSWAMVLQKEKTGNDQRVEDRQAMGRDEKERTVGRLARNAAELTPFDKLNLRY